MTESENDDLEHLRYSDPTNVDPDRPKPYQSAENLRELYHEREWSQSEIADFYNVSQATISRVMNDVGIKTRPAADERERRGIYRKQRPDFRAQYVVDNHGGSGDDELVRFYESNLVALHRAPLSLVTHDDTDVYHELNSPLHLNLPENLSILPSPVHQAGHVDDTQLLSEAFLERIGEPVDPEIDRRETIEIYLDPSAVKISSEQQEAASGEGGEA